MLETPDALPTWCSGTAAVAAEDAGPLDMPMPTAMAMSGSRNAEYFQDGSAKPTMTKPAVVRAKPTPIVCRPPNLAASRGTRGHDDQTDRCRQGGQPGLQRTEVQCGRFLEVQAEQVHQGV